MSRAQRVFSGSGSWPIFHKLQFQLEILLIFVKPTPILGKTNSDARKNQLRFQNTKPKSDLEENQKDAP